MSHLVGAIAVSSLRRPVRVSVTPHEQHDVDVLGMRLRYVDVGPRDAPPLLLVHGHVSRLEEYDAIVPHLARTHRVLVPDLPGCGYSDKPNRDYSLRLYEDVLLGFLDRLQVGPALLAGGSLGGNLTLRLGHREPDRFARLAAWAPAGAWEPAKLLAASGKTFGRLVGSAFFWPFVWVQSRYWYEKRHPLRSQLLRETFAFYREVHSRGFARMYFDIACDQLAHSHFQYASQIAQPTLLAWGDQDKAMSMDIGVKRLSQLLPRAELKIFPGRRHSLANEIPEELAKATIDFFNR